VEAVQEDGGQRAHAGREGAAHRRARHRGVLDRAEALALARVEHVDGVVGGDVGLGRGALHVPNAEPFEEGRLFHGRGAHDVSQGIGAPASGVSAR
jgi:hypothetical protein